VSGVEFEQRGRVKVQGQKVKVKVVFRGQEVEVDWSRSRGRGRRSRRLLWSVSLVFDGFLRVFARFSADFRAVSSAGRASGLGSSPGRPPASTTATPYMLNVKEFSKLHRLRFCTFGPGGWRGWESVTGDRVLTGNG
jgi:hypothetical protein